MGKPLTSRGPLKAPFVAAVDWPTFWPATVKITVDRLGHPWPVALVEPPGEMATGSTASCLAGGGGGAAFVVGGVVVGGVVTGGRVVVVVGLVVVVVLLVARAGRWCTLLGLGRVVVVVAGGSFFG